MTNFLVFDTETTGLPKRYNAPWNDLINWPRITQIAFLLCDKNGKTIESYQSLIKPDGWEIPKEKFFIDNNMSTERCEKEGIPIFNALRVFQRLLKQAHYKVAHNINFDNPIIGAEMIRNEITWELFKFKTGICTMHGSTKYCGLPGRFNSFKWPKLEELHKVLFNKGFEGAHDALSDVEATKKCLIELINRNVINLK